MTWLRQSDTLWRDFEFTKLTDGAQALWHRANSWIADQLSDGLIPESALKALNTRRRYVQELEQAGYWVWQPTGGWLARGWQEIIQSKASVVAKRVEQSQRDKTRSIRQKSSSLIAPSPSPSPISSVNQVAETEASVLALKPIVVSAPPTSNPAGRASRLIHEVTLVEWHPAGKWRPFLEALGAKPEAEWQAAREVLRREAQKPGVASDVLNPKHIVDHWSSHYAQGRAPGQRDALPKQAPKPQGVWAKRFEAVGE